MLGIFYLQFCQYVEQHVHFVVQRIMHAIEFNYTLLLTHASVCNLFAQVHLYVKINHMQITNVINIL